MSFFPNFNQLYNYISSTYKTKYEKNLNIFLISHDKVILYLFNLFYYFRKKIKTTRKEIIYRKIKIIYKNKTGKTR